MISGRLSITAIMSSRSWLAVGLRRPRSPKAVSFVAMKQAGVTSRMTVPSGSAKGVAVS
jgi:hypothetical protein